MPFGNVARDDVGILFVTTNNQTNVTLMAIDWRSTNACRRQPNRRIL